LLENCANVAIEDCTFEGGTFAIIARGRNCKNVRIERCFWQQDDWWQQNKNWKPEIWNRLPWTAIHGDCETAQKENRPCVNVETDARAYDGDFFRGFGVGRGFIFRDNFVRDALNGIHFFDKDSFAQDNPLGVPNPARDVLIERNRFLRIRDNTIELENDSANWIVRHNVFAENYKPFAIEAAHGGYIYVYGNIGWNTHRPGKDSGSTSNVGLSMFKVGTNSFGGGPSSRIPGC
jgi:hypothetical protein